MNEEKYSKAMEPLVQDIKKMIDNHKDGEIIVMRSDFAKEMGGEFIKEEKENKESFFKCVESTLHKNGIRVTDKSKDYMTLNGNKRVFFMRRLCCTWYTKEGICGFMAETEDELNIHGLVHEAGLVFRWNYIPGEDNPRLTKYLANEFNILNILNIEKSDDDMTIKISSEKKCLSLKLNGEKTKAKLKIDDGRTREFRVIARTDIYEGPIGLEPGSGPDWYKPDKKL